VHTPVSDVEAWEVADDLAQLHGQPLLVHLLLRDAVGAPAHLLAVGVLAILAPFRLVPLGLQERGMWMIMNFDRAGVSGHEVHGTLMCGV
jgi:hypothetical protein